MTIYEKMHSTALYLPNDEALVEEMTRCLDRLYDFNHTRPTEGTKRTAMLREMFAEIGEGATSNRRCMPISAANLSTSVKMYMPILT